jgi:hypothetical protein
MKPAKHKVAALLRQLPRCKVFQILGARDSSLKVSPLVTQIHPVTKSLNTVETIKMNARPHPGPLPPGEGESFAVSLRSKGVAQFVCVSLR